MQNEKWLKALELAQQINGHTASCWNTGGAEICQRCIDLAAKLEKKNQIEVQYV